MSDPEFDLIRPINGTAAAQRAQLVADPDLRRLLLWIQARSIQPGGLARLAQRLVEAFPRRVSVTVPEDVMEIECGVANAQDPGDPASWRDLGRRRLTQKEVEEQQAQGFQAVLDGLPDRISRLCLDPTAPLGGEIGTGWHASQFLDLVPSLRELRDRDLAQAREAHAHTSVGRSIWEHLDFCKRTRELVVICGREGIGKTRAVHAWLAANEGDARLITLTAANNQTEFFRALSKATGVASSYSQKAEEMKGRCVEFLRRTGTMLVVDEAHHVLPRGRRVESTPVLLEWIHGALRDSGVPVALVCTPQFRVQAANIEQRTGWNADQFLRRVKRFLMLPERLSDEDLRIVAQSISPRTRPKLLAAATAYAAMKEHQLDGLVDLLREAGHLAELDGSPEIRAEDLKRAMHEITDPTLVAKNWRPKPRQRVAIAASSSLPGDQPTLDPRPARGVLSSCAADAPALQSPRMGSAGHPFSELTEAAVTTAG